MTREHREERANSSTLKAKENTVLSPKFYTTDFEEIDRLDVSLLRKEWDQLMDELRADRNRDHFDRPASMRTTDVDLPEEARKQFEDFLVSSITSEFSGCVLYAEIKRRSKNKDVQDLFGMMARDESRHANFINQWLGDLGLGVDLGLLTKVKKTTFFKPKYIYYATYLSEKIGYARYITIFRTFERNPELRFHPIFQWFESWCNDEYRHGEAFALIMRANPHLLEGMNRLWIRFFLVAVFATMYVRDHTRTELHEAMGLDPTTYDFEVFRITSEITRQVFPFTLDIDNPRFKACLDRLCELSRQAEEAKSRGGLLGKLALVPIGLQAAKQLVSIYLLPTERNELPDAVRLAPIW
ncbi:MAG: magnesium-protoporphyrin IX monomethyl ester (oxidative) cyclase [Myxococcota bacterium]